MLPVARNKARQAVPGNHQLLRRRQNNKNEDDRYDAGLLLSKKYRRMSQATLKALFQEVEEVTQQRSAPVLKHSPSFHAPPSSRQARQAQRADEFESIFGEFVSRSPAKKDTTKPLSPRVDNKPHPATKSSQLKKQPGSLTLKENNKPEPPPKANRPTTLARRAPAMALVHKAAPLELKSELEVPAPSVEELRMEIQQKNLIESSAGMPTATRPSKKSKSLGVKEILRHAELMRKTDTEDKPKEKLAGNHVNRVTII